MTKDGKLRVGDVLKLPQFKHAEVVAGSRGLSHAIRWVHILEKVDSYDFLNGGELILSTATEFANDHTKCLTYLQGAIQRKAAGLCIELGEHIQQIPPCMCEMADHHEFPLLLFHQPVRFVDITLDLHQMILDQQSTALRHLESYSRSLQRLTLEGTSLMRILNHFQQMVQSQTFYISLDGHTIYAPPMTNTVQVEMNELLQDSLFRSHNVSAENRIIAISDQKRIIYQPITAMGQILAYIGLILFEKDPDNFLILALDNTALAIGQILLRKMFSQEQELKTHDRLLGDILQNKMQEEETIRSQLGLPLTMTKSIPYFAAVIEFFHKPVPDKNEQDQLYQDLLGLIRSLINRNGYRSLLSLHGNRLYMLIIKPNGFLDYRKDFLKIIVDLERTCCQAFGTNVRLEYGVSRLSERYALAKTHFDEAEQILKHFSFLVSPFFEDLGIQAVILHINKKAVFHTFIEKYIGELLRHEEDHGGQLLLTLRTYLDYRESKQEVAERLFISRQTLYQRLEKICELLGESYLEPKNRVCIELALRFNDWVRVTSPS